jgi:hypothetical protein
MWEPITPVGACPICGSLPNLWELLLAIIAIFENRILVQYNGSYPEKTSF